MNGEPDGAPDRAGLSARRQRARRSTPATPSCSRCYHRDVHGADGQVIDLSLFESLFSLLGPLPAEYAAARPPARARRQPLAQRRSARLLPHLRRRLDRGQRLDARRWPSASCAATASSTCSRIRALPPTARASSTSRELDDEVARAIAARTLAENVAIIDANAAHRRAGADDRRHRGAPALAGARPDRRRAERLRRASACTTSSRGCRSTPGEIRWAGGELGAGQPRHLRRRSGSPATNSSASARAASSEPGCDVTERVDVINAVGTCAAGSSLAASGRPAPARRSTVTRQVHRRGHRHGRVRRPRAGRRRRRRGAAFLRRARRSIRRNATAACRRPPRLDRAASRRVGRAHHRRGRPADRRRAARKSPRGADASSCRPRRASGSSARWSRSRARPARRIAWPSRSACRAASSAASRRSIRR